MPILLDPVRVQDEAAKARIAEVAAYLQETLGQKITAYLSGLADPKMVGKWARGQYEPRDMAATRLRHAFQIAKLLAGAYDPETAKAWLFGTNSRLGDKAPAVILRHATDVAELSLLVPTARAFAGIAD